MAKQAFKKKGNSWLDSRGKWSYKVNIRLHIWSCWNNVKEKLVDRLSRWQMNKHLINFYQNFT